MNEITSYLLESPLKSGCTAITATSISYAAFKGLQYALSTKQPTIPLPPGPTREPIIGTLRSFPKDHFFRGFCEWAESYGDIVYAPLPGMSIAVLNSYEIAQELLLKRPSSTAGRRIGYLVLHLMGLEWSTAFLQPGPSHSNQRKMLRKSIGPQRVTIYNMLIETEAAKLMLTLQNLKGDPARTIQNVVGCMVTKATYGQKIWDEMGEGLSRWNLEMMDLVNEAFFAFWMVDIIPSLRFVPEWFPGTRFKQIGREGTLLSSQIRDRAYERVQQLYNAGTLDHCIANDLLEEFGSSEDVRDAMATLYTASSDTTTAAVIAFLHTMFLFPEVSKRVFEEIQSVTYGERLLLVAERSQLPYTEAAWKEAVRWRPFIPVGVPHVNSEDEIINGYLIPKGTMIHQNNGLMLTDPRVWEDPEVFRPERFLEEEVANRPNPLTLIFGYGMRVCPGMYLADKVAFHLAITILSLFNIVPLDGCKFPDPDTIEYTDTAFRHPIGFECQFIPRNEKTEQLLSTVALSESTD